jgi:hypothetical protein
VIIDPLFKGTALSNEGLDKAVGIAEAFTKLLQVLDEVCPKSREFSIARTKLEEASFYAKKSLVNYQGNRNDETPVVETQRHPAGDPIRVSVAKI